ncbi:MULTISPECIES: hypothetical protein [Pseudoalteromonas]|uniref:hypothetical protein n=1 Tax=Pseudoalteromonas TaxID=53246 RepID=UPI0002E0F670|nr:hypothetical protein [Pseudoalteromonas flavipulchra]
MRYSSKVKSTKRDRFIVLNSHFLEHITGGSDGAIKDDPKLGPKENPNKKRT